MSLPSPSWPTDAVLGMAWAVPPGLIAGHTADYLISLLDLNRISVPIAAVNSSCFHLILLRTCCSNVQSEAEDKNKRVARRLGLRQAARWVWSLFFVVAGLEAWQGWKGPALPLPALPIFRVHLHTAITFHKLIADHSPFFSSSSTIPL